MKSDNNLFKLAQQGFRVTLGAAAAFVETVQNQQKRESTLSELLSTLEQKVQEWEEKGEITEQEARRIVDQFLSQDGGGTSSGSSSSSTGGATPSTSSGVSNTKIQTELRELTSQITLLRSELEKEKSSEN